MERSAEVDGRARYKLKNGRVVWISTERDGEKDIRL